MKFFRIAFIIGFVFSSALWASVGKVSLLKGEAYAKRDAQTIVLYTGFFLETNDAIITGKESQVQLLFDDKTVITLGGESDFKIEEYLNDAQNPKAKFKFNQGTFKTITGNIGKTSPENFKMETKTATIGIRGTISGGTVPPPPPRDTSPLPELFFCFSGVITITPLSPPNETIDVPAGHMVILPFDAPPSIPRPFTREELKPFNLNLGFEFPTQLNRDTRAQEVDSPRINTLTITGEDDTPPLLPLPLTPANTPPLLRTFLPMVAEDSLTINLETLAFYDTIETIADDLNISADTIINQLRNETCPFGTVGVYPYCTADTEGSEGGGGGGITATGLKGRFTSQYGLDIKDFWIEAVSIVDSNFTQGTLNSPWSNGATIDLNSTRTSVVSGSVGENVYWGKWTSTALDTFNYLPANITPTEYNFWVAGTPTAVAYLTGLANVPSTLSTYTYTGKVLGALYNGTTYQDILPSDPTNSLVLAFNFGGGYRSMDITQSSLQFTPQGGTLWDLSFSHSGQVGTETFSGSFLGPYSGMLVGYFYGATAQALGGSFRASSGGEVAYGVFSGSKTNETTQAITTSVMKGYATSWYNLGAGGQQLGVSWFDMLPVDTNTILGGIPLNRSSGTTQLPFYAATTVYTDDNNFTIDNFGALGTHLETVALPSGISDSVTWGKWTSVELEGGNTTKATTENFWMAGKYMNEASTGIQAKVYSTTIGSYSYSGKVLGSMYDGAYHAITPSDPTNTVLLTFLFGKSGTGLDSSKSYITFTPTGGTLWELYFGSNPMGSNSISTDGYFQFNVSTIGYTGIVEGDAYGLTAQSMGGRFKATRNGNLEQAYGVFVANETPTPATTLSLTGFNAFQGLYGEHVTMGLTLFENNTSSVGWLQKVVVTDYALISLFDTSASLTYINDHNFTLTTDNATLHSIALASGASNDYASWGTWIDNTSYEGFWVAGKDAALAARHISEKAGSAETYSYSGKVLGKAGVYDGASHIYQDIAPNDPTNKVVLTFDFGSQIALDTSRSYISFTPVGGTLWQLYFGSTFEDADGDRFQAYFGGEYGGGLGLNFYGDAAQSIGGGFSACKNDSCSDNDVAYGVFIGNKTSTPPLFLLSGFSTSSFDDGGTVTYSILDPIMIEATDSEILAKTVLMSEDNTTRGSASGFYSLDDMGVASGIHDFNNTKIWTEIDTSPSNDYVSWGYWVSTDEDGGAKLKAGTNYWVAGKDAAAAAAFIENLPSTNPTPYYIYTGKVLGSVIDNGVESAIDTASSSVQLKFQFGGGVKSFYDDSVGTQYNWIRFTDASSQLWDLRPTLTTPNVTNGKFSDGLGGTIDTPLAPTNVTGTINGQFFGNSAQAVGGTFKASDATQTLKAIGVFKAVK